MFDNGNLPFDHIFCYQVFRGIVLHRIELRLCSNMIGHWIQKVAFAGRDFLNFPIIAADIIRGDEISRRIGRKGIHQLAVIVQSVLCPCQRSVSLSAFSGFGIGFFNLYTEFLQLVRKAYRDIPASQVKGPRLRLYEFHRRIDFRYRVSDDFIGGIVHWQIHRSEPAFRIRRINAFISVIRSNLEFQALNVAVLRYLRDPRHLGFCFILEGQGYFAAVNDGGRLGRHRFVSDRRIHLLDHIADQLVIAVIYL